MNHCARLDLYLSRRSHDGQGWSAGSSIRDGCAQIHDLKIDDVKTRVFGDAAVVTGRTHGIGAFEGTGYEVVIRFTDTFMRRAGRWQAVASHASLVQGP